MKTKTKSQVMKILLTGVIMGALLVFFKFIPMGIWGKDILFDASMHLTGVIFILYIIYFFIDQNKDWRVPYLIISLSIITIVSLQRIVSNAHNDIGLLMGLGIAIVSIIITNWKDFKRRIEF